MQLGRAGPHVYPEPPYGLEAPRPDAHRGSGQDLAGGKSQGELGSPIAFAAKNWSEQEDLILKVREQLKELETATEEEELEGEEWEEDADGEKEEVEEPVA